MERRANCGRSRTNDGRPECPRRSGWIEIFCIRRCSSWRIRGRRSRSSSLGRYRRNWRPCWIAWKMLGKKVLGWNLGSKTEAPFQRGAAGYNEEINSDQVVLMKSRIFLFLFAFRSEERRLVEE